MRHRNADHLTLYGGSKWAIYAPRLRCAHMVPACRPPPTFIHWVDYAGGDWREGVNPY